MIGIDEFLAHMKEELAAFERVYRKKAAEDPNLWPEKMSPGDWDEQLFVADWIALEQELSQ